MTSDARKRYKTALAELWHVTDEELEAAHREAVRQEKETTRQTFIAKRRSRDEFRDRISKSEL